MQNRRHTHGEIRFIAATVQEITDVRRGISALLVASLLSVSGATSSLMVASVPAQAQSNFDGLQGTGALSGMIPQKKQGSADPNAADYDPFPHKDLPFAEFQPAPLPFKNIPGLSSTSQQVLEGNLFVAVNNTQFNSAAELYKNNRQTGYGNFVTVDSIAHPYFAYSNYVRSKMILEHLIPDLKALLVAMGKEALEDNKETQDAAVKKDIKHNVAFLALAIHLLDAAAPVPSLDDSSSLVNADLKNITSGKHATSAIFGTDTDFSMFKPQGWMASSAGLRNFFRCYQWLSRMTFSLNESEKGNGDSFRRSAILFGDFERTTLHGSPATKVWERINTAMTLIGSQPYTGEKTLSIPDYEQLLKPRANSDGVLNLATLADPFYRTKLLLSVKRNKPVELISSSIFELQQKKSEGPVHVYFHFFPTLEDPELLWMRLQGPPADEVAGNQYPFALLALHAHGSPQATNLLGDSTWGSDLQLQRSVPSLVRQIRAETTAAWPWSVYPTYDKPTANKAQTVFRLKNWLSRRCESLFAGWVDSHVAMWPHAPSDKPMVETPTDLPPGVEEELGVKKAAGASKPTTSSVFADGVGGSKGTGAQASKGTVGTEAATANSGAAPRANFHYLEPYPDVFRQMRLQSRHMAAVLDQVDYYPQDCRNLQGEFERLLQRLETIGMQELGAEPVNKADSDLLANIDIVLDKITPSSPATFWISCSPKLGEPEGAQGVCLGLGRPSALYILVRSMRGPTLLKGSLYTYYEIPGPPVSLVHWLRKLDYNLVQPQQWASNFDIVQDKMGTNLNQ